MSEEKRMLGNYEVVNSIYIWRWLPFAAFQSGFFKNSDWR